MAILIGLGVVAVFGLIVHVIKLDMDGDITPGAAHLKRFNKK